MTNMEAVNDKKLYILGSCLNWLRFLLKLTRMKRRWGNIEVILLWTFSKLPSLFWNSISFREKSSSFDVSNISNISKLSSFDISGENRPACKISRHVDGREKCRTNCWRHHQGNWYIFIYYLCICTCSLYLYLHLSSLYLYSTRRRTTQGESW